MIGIFMAKNRPNQFKGATPVTDKTTETTTQEAQSQEASLQAEQTGENTAAPQETQAATDTTDQGGEQGAEPEATQAPAATQAPVVTEAPAPVATPAPAPVAAVATDSAQELLQERLAGTLTKTEAIVRDTISQYLEEVKPGRPVQAEFINRNQLMLWRLILRVIEAPDDTEFEKGFTLLVAYFRANRKSALGEYHVFRGMDTITLDQDTTAAFQRALNLLIICATVSGPKEAGRHADLGRSLPEGVYSDNARNRLLSFLS
jgi:hypothetical protein